MANEPGYDQTSDKFLDLLLDALIERNNERKRAGNGRKRHQQVSASEESVPEKPSSSEGPIANSESTARPAVGRVPRAGEVGWVPAPPARLMGLERTLGKLLLLVAFLAIVVNIPLTAHGVSLARLLPDKDALVIRDGLLVKGSGPEVYVLMSDELHWIPTLSAFEKAGYDWDHVHEVDEMFLSQFSIGEPAPQLLKCEDQPHVYHINADGTRSWIADIHTFVAEGYVWDDVVKVPCAELSSIPRGATIPPGRGTPEGE